jgi:hypothetical protein
MSNEMNLEQAEGWKPEVGDVVVGTVVDLARQRSEYTGDLYPIITVQRDDGTLVAIHCFHTVLRNRMIELQPQIGETIGVKYISETEEVKEKGKKTRNKPAIYNVRVKGRSADIWGGMQVSHDMPVNGTSDIPADASDFTPDVAAQEDEDIPF